MSVVTSVPIINTPVGASALSTPVNELMTSTFSLALKIIRACHEHPYGRRLHVYIIHLEGKIQKDHRT